MINREIKFQAFVLLDTGGIMMNDVTLYANGTIGFDAEEFSEQLPKNHYLDYDCDCVRHSDNEDIFDSVLPVLFGDDWIWLEPPNFKLRQFIGMPDKSGKEIYEHDIIKTEQGTLFIVEWNNEYLMWVLLQANKGVIRNHPELQADHFHLQKHMQPNLEIIGNIYKDADLLKTKA